MLNFYIFSKPWPCTFSVISHWHKYNTCGMKANGFHLYTVLSYRRFVGKHTGHGNQGIPGFYRLQTVPTKCMCFQKTYFWHNALWCVVQIQMKMGSWKAVLNFLIVLIQTTVSSTCTSWRKSMKCQVCSKYLQNKCGSGTWPSVQNSRDKRWCHIGSVFYFNKW